ncbi:hypothetical protein F5Y14DRAFT_131786 [Nemania sp. NC0429]|nr:hypothetical protein F5Y14DRAFT_131786 [Nemania sp. NC0429]
MVCRARLRTLGSLQLYLHSVIVTHHISIDMDQSVDGALVELPSSPATPPGLHLATLMFPRKLAATRTNTGPGEEADSEFIQAAAITSYIPHAHFATPPCFPLLLISARSRARPGHNLSIYHFFFMLLLFSIGVRTIPSLILHLRYAGHRSRRS